MPKTTDSPTVTTRYNFDAPINQAEEESDEDLELSKKMAREMEQKADNIQPYKEAIKAVNLGTKEEIKLRGNVRAEPQRS